MGDPDLCNWDRFHYGHNGIQEPSSGLGRVRVKRGIMATENNMVRSNDNVFITDRSSVISTMMTVVPL